MDDIENKDEARGQSRKTVKGYIKAFVIIALVVLMLVSAIEDSTLIYEGYLGRIWLFSFLFGTPIIIFSCQDAPKPGDAGWKLYKCYRKPMWLLVVFSPVLAMLFFGAPLARGLPVILHYLTAKQGGEMVVTVEKRISRKRCWRGADIEEFTYFLNDEICDLKKEFWEGLRPGQKILLRGRVSDFGFTYK